MAQLNGAIKVVEKLPNESWDDYLKREEKFLEDLEKNAKQYSVEGHIISFPVADGNALYLVTKEKPLTLQHIPIGDAYQVPPAMIRGLRLSDVKDMLLAKKLFGG